MRALEEGGYILGYRAELDRRKVGLGVLAFVRVDAERNSGEATRMLEEAIRQLPEVTSCHYISGAGTFELQVVATDLDHFSRFARECLINLPHVKDLHTSFSLGEANATAEQLVERHSTPAVKHVTARVIERTEALLALAQPLPQLLSGDPFLKAEVLRLLGHARYQIWQLKFFDPLTKKLTTPFWVRGLIRLQAWWLAKR